MANKNRKYIFVVGGVLSGVGKGIMSASIGAIIRAKGKKVSVQKCDPYLNVDAGLLNPKEHGECFVTSDGLETDLDLGHYERFLDIETNRHSSTLSGRLIQDLLNEERQGVYGGQTIQLVPHLVNKIKAEIRKSAEVSGSDVHIVEIGGTVGDYEGLSFIEAIREFAMDEGRENCLFVSVLFVPWLNTSGELKTKPAQNAIRDLRGFGISPDIVAIRTEKPAPKEIIGKMARLSGVSENGVILLPDVKSVFDVPINIMKSGVDKLLDNFLKYKGQTDLSDWERLSHVWQKTYTKNVRVGLVAKYIGNTDSYLSVTEALKAASKLCKVNLEVVWIDAEKVTKADLEKVDGILVPGGFGTRGIDGKIVAADFALGGDVPYLGICLGLQVGVIAAARRGGLKDAGTEEAGASEKDGNNVIYIMPDQKGRGNTGGSMRLGNYEAKLEEDTRVFDLYRDFGAASTVRDYETIKNFNGKVVERHRHRYEVNTKFLDNIKKGGLKVSGTGKNSSGAVLVEFVEGSGKGFFVATQAHPEFRSRPMRPHPLFIGFIKAIKERVR